LKAPRRRREERPPERGRFVVLEGIDGAGTTTQTGELVRRLQARGIHARGTSEPSRGPIGVLLRGVLSRRLTGPGGAPFDRGALALLFASDRLDHVAAEIEPTLAAGEWVVSDRYLMSSLAYQALDVPLAFVAAANARAPRPDLTLFLNVPAEVALRRRQAEHTNAELFEELDLQRRVAQNYHARIAEDGASAGPVLVLDGTRSIGEIADEIEQRLDERFRLSRRPSRAPA
jgi:dTMP kinase